LVLKSAKWVGSFDVQIQGWVVSMVAPAQVIPLASGPLAIATQI